VVTSAGRSRNCPITDAWTGSKISVTRGTAVQHATSNMPVRGQIRGNNDLVPGPIPKTTKLSII
jgi:hypothetical protein